jgi:hypothetical protein
MLTAKQKYKPHKNKINNNVIIWLEEVRIRLTSSPFFSFDTLSSNISVQDGPHFWNPVVSRLYREPTNDHENKLSKEILAILKQAAWNQLYALKNPLGKNVVPAPSQIEYLIRRIALKDKKFAKRLSEYLLDLQNSV